METAAIANYDADPKSLFIMYIILYRYNDEKLNLIFSYNYVIIPKMSKIKEACPGYLLKAFQIKLSDTV
jgi:hypothetical protein